MAQHEAPTEQTPEERLYDAISSAIIASYGEEAFVTGFYLLIEYTDPSGKRWLVRRNDDDSPPWLHIGWLRAELADVEASWTRSEDEDDGD